MQESLDEGMQHRSPCLGHPNWASNGAEVLHMVKGWDGNDGNGYHLPGSVATSWRRRTKMKDLRMGNEGPVNGPRENGGVQHLTNTN